LHFKFPGFSFERGVEDCNFRKPILGAMAPNRTNLTSGCISEIY